MKEETKNWLKFSRENLESAKILLQSHLYNPALHNAQQSVEKSLKSLFIENGISLRKTHSILELKNILSKEDFSVDITDDECELLDSIYLPTKYPIGSALPDFNPDEKITLNCIDIAERVYKTVYDLLSGK